MSAFQNMPGLAALAAFAREELAETDQSGNKVYKKLVYASQEPYWSTAWWLTGATGAITAGTNRQIFQNKVGDPAGSQGGNWQLSYADTNVEVGSQFPRDQCFVAWGASHEFAFYSLDTVTGSALRNVQYTAGSPVLLQMSANDVAQVQASVSWTFEETGQIKRYLGLSENFPSGIGVYNTPVIQTIDSTNDATTAPVRGLSQNGGPLTSIQKWSTPMVLRPLVNTKQVLNFEKSVDLSNGSAIYLGIKTTLFGTRFNIVG